MVAPVGGATGLTRRCRGCRLLPVFAVLALLAQPVAAQQELAVTGLSVTYHDTIAEPPTYRVRYLAPALVGRDLAYVDVAADMQALCAEDALPRLTAEGADPARVVVTLMSEAVEFGVMSRDATQFFESYTIDEGRCIWEAF